MLSSISVNDRRMINYEILNIYHDSYGIYIKFIIYIVAIWFGVELPFYLL